jgi:hypothetical protein
VDLPFRRREAQSRMSITLSPEAAAKAAAIPDFSERLERFVDQQYKLEQWRTKHYSPAVRDIMRRALEEAAALREQGVPREQLFAELFSSLDETQERGAPND